MPPLPEKTFVALDLAGCPNRCRHCWLGAWPNRRLTPDDLAWAVAQFRATSAFDEITALSWWREPDYCRNYEALYALEGQLSDGPAQRFELLSIWRLARDPGYARWAREIGTEACQITLFGLARTHDWFVRRQGSFRDSLLATERLLAAGIRPRWQLFFTRPIIPELPGLMALIDEMRLAERTERLGGPFNVFMHTPGPEGEAWEIEDLRPEVADLDAVPEALRTASERYLGHGLGQAEGTLTAQRRETVSTAPIVYEVPAPFGFYVANNWDVYTNQGTLAPWWRLGNLKQDPLAAILERLENETPLGYRIIYGLPLAELARRHGRPKSTRLYTGGDLEARWVRLEALARWRSQRDPRREQQNGAASSLNSA